MEGSSPLLPLPSLFPLPRQAAQTKVSISRCINCRRTANQAPQHQPSPPPVQASALVLCTTVLPRFGEPALLLQKDTDWLQNEFVHIPSHQTACWFCD